MRRGPEQILGVPFVAAMGAWTVADAPSAGTDGDPDAAAHLDEAADLPHHPASGRVSATRGLTGKWGSRARCDRAS